MSVYIPIEKIRMAWRKAYSVNPNVDELEAANHMKIHREGDALTGYSFDALEFDNEQAYLAFLLRWA